MTTLGEFHSSVRDALGRGHALDAAIAASTRRAVMWLERNADPGYAYMRKSGKLTLDASASFPHIIDLPNERLKCLLMFRLATPDGYSYLTKIDPRDVSVLDIAKPQGYWYDGTRRMVLDAKPDEDYSAELLWVEFSAWSDDDDFRHWLLDFAEDVLFAKTMLGLSTYVRDARMRAALNEDLLTGLTTLESFKIDLENENTDVRMNYV